MRTGWIPFAAASTIALAMATAGFVSLATAHGGYERSQPAQNESLPESPGRVDVWFTQEVLKQEGANFVRVFDEQEVQVSEGEGVVDDDDRTHVYATLPPNLPEGRYVVRWKTTSDVDLDTTSGAFCFFVGVEPSPQQESECSALDQSESDEDGGSAATAAIVGGVAGIVALIVVAAGVAVWLRRRPA